MVATEESGCPGSVKIAADLLGFVLITTATIYIAYKNATYRGPSGTERNFNGYREENMLALFVNIFASVAYWARVIANANCSPGFAMLTQIRYADYMTTCPLLVLDLLWNLEAPYKGSCAVLILITILTGLACSTLPAPQSYLWFGFGDVIFVVVYVILVMIVRERLNFFISHAKNQQALKAMYYLKFACCCFFLIWIWYPVLWIISPYCLDIIEMEVLDFLHMILDVVAKSTYGVVLLWFRWNYDKKLLRNEEEEEYIEFSSRHPDRKAKMQIRIEDEESDTEDGQEGGSDPASRGLKKGAEQKGGGEKASKTVNTSGLIQPFTTSPRGSSGKPIPEHEGKGTYGTGSRLLFASNRRESMLRPTLILPSALQRLASDLIYSIVLHPTLILPSALQRLASDSSRGHPLHTSSAGYQNSNGNSSSQERWLHELGQYMEEHGFSNPSGTLAKLEQAGLTDTLLRTCVTDEDLQELGIETGARRVILGRYGRGAGEPAIPEV